MILTRYRPTHTLGYVLYKCMAGCTNLNRHLSVVNELLLVTNLYIYSMHQVTG